MFVYVELHKHVKVICFTVTIKLHHKLNTRSNDNFEFVSNCSRCSSMCCFDQFNRVCVVSINSIECVLFPSIQSNELHVILRVSHW
jgi:hypothetical protein